MNLNTRDGPCLDGVKREKKAYRKGNGGGNNDNSIIDREYDGSKKVKYGASPRCGADPRYGVDLKHSSKSMYNRLADSKPESYVHLRAAMSGMANGEEGMDSKVYCSNDSNKINQPFYDHGDFLACCDLKEKPDGQKVSFVGAGRKGVGGGLGVGGGIGVGGGMGNGYVPSESDAHFLQSYFTVNKESGPKKMILDSVSKVQFIFDNVYSYLHDVAFYLNANGGFSLYINELKPKLNIFKSPHAAERNDVDDRLYYKDCELFYRRHFEERKSRSFYKSKYQNFIEENKDLVAVKNLAKIVTSIDRSRCRKDKS